MSISKNLFQILENYGLSCIDNCDDCPTKKIECLAQYYDCLKAAANELEEIIKKDDPSFKQLSVSCPDCGYKQLEYSETCCRCGEWLI